MNKCFTCIGRGVKAPAVPATREDWERMRREPWLIDLCRRIAAGDDALKQQLPIWTPHCAEFRANHRATQDALRPLSRLMLDFDEKGHTDEIKARLMAQSPLKVLLIEESARHGTHVLVALPEGTTIDEAQRLMRDATGFEPDKAVRDVARCIYMVPESHTRYVSQELFDVPDQPVAPQPQPQPEQKPAVAEPPAVSTKTFKGRPYADIISAWWQRNGGVPQEGERNVKLYQLATSLRAICDNRKELLMEVMPRLGLSEQELRGIVDSACKEPPKGLSKMMSEILKGVSTEAVTEGVPPAIPKRLPRLIQLLTSNTPDVYKPAVAHAVFPALATHLCNVSFSYTNNEVHEATLMNVLMAHTGAGKGCIDKPIKHIMADIRRRDQENEQREQEWKTEVNTKGANKDKRKRPDGLVIQIIDPDMTKPALVTRMNESEGHFVYVKLNELDLFDQLKGQTGRQQFQLMCLAFDPESEYGQTRFGTQSVTARPRCRFNWNACSTILKGQRYFAHVLTDGPVSRINFCTIPPSEIGSPQPIYGIYDAAFDEALKPYIDHLCEARGLISCPQATRLARRLQQHCAEVAQLSQDEVYWNLSLRACVIAWLKACVLYVANGMKWEKTIDDFILWSLDYDLWCKMEFFGDAIRQAERGDQRLGTRGPRNLLELLPDVFTLDDARRVKMERGLGGEKVMNMVRNWINRGYVIQYSEFSFKKLQYLSES